MTNKEKKAKWIEALESGKYRQVKECLVDGDSYCCIGIYGVEVMGIDRNMLDIHKMHDLSETQIGSSVYDSSMYALMPDIPKVYMEFSDLFGETIKDFAIRLNDKGKTFAEIATEAKGWPVLSDPMP